MEDKENGNFGIEEAEREEMKANGDEDEDEGEGIDDNIGGNRISNKKVKWNKPFKFINELDFQ
jgi:hypothetical protein